MFRRPRRPLVAVIAGAALAIVAAGVQTPAQAAAPTGSVDTDTGTGTNSSTGTGTGTVAEVDAGAASADAARRVKFERWATIQKLPENRDFPNGGYYYDAGQQNTELVITRVDGGVRLADRHTDVLRSKPHACDEKRSSVGIVVVCRVPRSIDARHPMTVKVFTRIGDDYIDSSSLSAAFELYVLADIGSDTVRTGAGDDFVNGAQNRDRVWGGAGDDWISTGLGNDTIVGGPGKDKIIGAYDKDVIRGGRGDDLVYGGPGNDRLFPGPGSDRVVCGPGVDIAKTSAADHVARDCESVNFR